MENIKDVNKIIIIYRKYKICRSCVFQEGEPAVSTEKHEYLAYTYTTTRPTTNLLPELLLIVQTRSPCRIISIERKMEERNNTLEQVKRRKISLEDKINME